MRYITAQEGVVIPLGRQGENEVTTIQFDSSGWKGTYSTSTGAHVYFRFYNGYADIKGIFAIKR